MPFATSAAPIPMAPCWHCRPLQTSVEQQKDFSISHLSALNTGSGGSASVKTSIRSSTFVSSVFIASTTCDPFDLVAWIDTNSVSFPASSLKSSSHVTIGFAITSPSSPHFSTRAALSPISKSITMPQLVEKSSHASLLLSLLDLTVFHLRQRRMLNRCSIFRQQCNQPAHVTPNFSPEG